MTKKTFVICLTMQDFMSWRASINYSIPNRDCVAVLTAVDGYAERFRGYDMNEHDLVRWGAYDRGPHWPDVEDELSVAQMRVR